MAFLLGALRLLVLLLVVRFVVRAFHAMMRSPARPAGRPAAPPNRAKAVHGSHLVRDRVCNTFVPEERALSASIHGHVEHFCSEACRQKALADVARAS